MHFCTYIFQSVLNIIRNTLIHEIIICNTTSFGIRSVNPHNNSSNQSSYQAEVYFYKSFQINIFLKLLDWPGNTASHGELIQANETLLPNISVSQDTFTTLPSVTNKTFHLVFFTEIIFLILKNNSSSKMQNPKTKKIFW